MTWIFLYIHRTIKRNEMKTWKKIKGFDLYQISSEGEILWTNRKKIIEPFVEKGGYCVVSLKSNSNKWTTKRIHHLVAEHFIDGYVNEDKWRLTHRDENKSNNSVKNLYLRDSKHKYIRLNAVNKTQVLNLVNKIKIRGWLDSIDILRIASIHVDLFGDVYGGDPETQIGLMWSDIQEYTTLVK